MTSPPYECIYFLTIENSSGGVFYGSGFNIHPPNANFTAIVTAGHCTYDTEYGWASKITVSFPGEAPIYVHGYNLYAAPQYVTSGNPDYDYGLKLLPRPGTPDKGFGWSVIGLSRLCS